MGASVASVEPAVRDDKGSLDISLWALIDSLRERAGNLDPNAGNASQALATAERELIADPVQRDRLRAMAYARYRAARDHRAQIHLRLRQAEDRLRAETDVYYFLEALTASDSR